MCVCVTVCVVVNVVGCCVECGVLFFFWWGGGGGGIWGVLFKGKGLSVVLITDFFMNVKVLRHWLCQEIFRVMHGQIPNLWLNLQICIIIN